jgi:purine-binding chemotaxis protein CheW
MQSQQRYLCFNLGAEQFSIPLLTAKEVIGMPAVTPFPQAPDSFLGITNLRGKIISILDLRLKLSLPQKKTRETAVIVLDLEDYFLGVVVDQVNSVQQLSNEDIEESPGGVKVKNSEFVSGVFRKEDQLVLLLDIEKCLTVEERRISKADEKKAS